MEPKKYGYSSWLQLVTNASSTSDAFVVSEGYGASTPPTLIKREYALAKAMEELLPILPKDDDVIELFFRVKLTFHPEKLPESALFLQKLYKLLMQ